MTGPEPPSSARGRSRVAVIGGGISGLAAAHHLSELLAEGELTLFEAAPRLGGVLDTHRRDGFLIERSADNFLTKLPWATDLCHRLGLGEELLPTNESRRRALVVHHGLLQPVPEGFVLMSPRRLGSILSSPVLSPLGKLRLLCEPLVGKMGATRNAASDVSVAEFARHRLGREVFERLVQPLLAGIYTADPERLSLAATMPQFLRQVREHGSLLRAALSSRERSAADRESGARYSLFVAPQQGMTSLVEALVAKLPAAAIRLNTPVEKVEVTESGAWRVTLAGDSQPEPFRAVIVATPAPVAARIIGPVDAELAATLSEIEYAGSVVVSLGLRREQVSHPLDGFGFVVPAVERRRIIAASFSSLKFPRRAPEGHLLIRAFVGGALQPELTQLDDEDLRDLAIDELGELIGLRGDPLLVDVARWPRSMPQYHVGHLDRVTRVERLAAKHRGLELAGNAYHGVGIPQCIRSGEQAAQRVARTVGSA